MISLFLFLSLGLQSSNSLKYVHTSGSRESAAGYTTYQMENYKDFVATGDNSQIFNVSHDQTDSSGLINGMASIDFKDKSTEQKDEMFTIKFKRMDIIKMHHKQ